MSNPIGWKFGSFIRAEAMERWDRAVNILEEFLKERLHQNAKWGDDAGLSQHELLSILVEKVGGVAHEINEINVKYARLIKLENLDPAEAQLMGFENADELEERRAGLAGQIRIHKDALRRELIQVGAVAAKQIEILDTQ